MQLPERQEDRITLEEAVRKPYFNFCCLIIVSIIMSLIACAGGNRGTLKRVQEPTEDGLRQDWKEYDVYYRLGLALIFKIKNDRKIILDKRWVKVTSEDMMTKNKILDPTWVREIGGNNGERLGYLVHRYADVANVKIIDENTVQLYYTYIRTSGGP